MDKYISYRHNIMGINSIDTFLNVKGGFSRNQRDVYFVRGLGSMPDIAANIQSIDRRMCREVCDNRLFYQRISKLPPLASGEEIDFYAKQYESWRSSGIAQLKNNDTLNFSRVLGCACSETIEKYKLIKPNLTESIEKNFVVKLLFWTDKVLGGALGNWTERMCFKIIGDNVLKEQEYLFYYMLTLIGCDVLLLQRISDIDTISDIKSLSAELYLGQYDSVPLPEFVPHFESEGDKKSKNSVINSNISATDGRGGNNEMHGGRVIISAASLKRPDSRHSINNGSSGNNSGNSSNSSAVINNNNNRNNGGAAIRSNNDNRNNSNSNGNNEKSFEELARLASSIVMITVLNKKGQPEATGSGIMIGRGGYILTNCHVTRGGSFFAVQIEEDENIYRTDELIKYNPVLDLAVMRIDRELKPLELYRGKDKLVRGQKVVAIGSPLGLFNSVSDGIISGFRNVNNVDMIQFTAPISHGSSGGAVLNMQGQVIGISTAGIDQGQNINLAVGYENINMFVRGFTG